MHVVTGGAYNGKAAWVKEYYKLDQKKNFQWFNAYEDKPLPKSLENHNGMIVFEGIEQWVYQWMKGKGLEEARKYGRYLIEEWVEWEEKDKGNHLIVLCTDISKGIVPMDADMRKWRDLTGWFYQDLVNGSKQVHLIWYGIAKQIK